jgi:peptidoglycan/xylan/chitin deacetylase (PgdA/CDA1 family)
MLRSGVLVPFAERGGALRGLLDVATGCYPAFLFGGSIGAQVPVFHFHDEPRPWLERRLQYLADNGYRTITSDEIARFVIDGVAPGPRAIALTFDDAWASVWTVAFPLLKQYGLRATVFAIPGRIEDAPEAPRSPIGDGGPATPKPRSGEGGFVTWSQLREMHTSGVVDVQSHTQWHVMMFSSATLAGFVRPSFAAEPLLNRPLMSATIDGSPRFLEADALGAPLFVRRSRMSDARRFLPDGRAEDRCRDIVAKNGAEAFFARPDWRAVLEGAAADSGGHYESDADRSVAIREELSRGREELNARLGIGSVKHIALPWGIAGELTSSLLAETGHTTAFAERPLQRRAVRAGDDRFRLMRLNGKFVTCLPGRQRQWFFTTVR